MIKTKKFGELIITEILVMGVPLMTYARIAKPASSRSGARHIYAIENCGKACGAAQ